MYQNTLPYYYIYQNNTNFLGYCFFVLSSSETSIQDNDISTEELSDMCLPLVGNASSVGLVDRVLLLHPRSADDLVSDLFLERVTQTQACAYDAAQTNGWLIDKI